jgi:hypothetical protein
MLALLQIVCNKPDRRSPGAVHEPANPLLADATVSDARGRRGRCRRRCVLFVSPLPLGPRKW